MPATEMIVMVAMFAALALSFVYVLRLINTAILHKTVRRAVDRDPASAEGLLNQLAQPRPTSGDDRLSVILVAVGIAIAAASIIAVDDPGVVRLGIAASLFPLIVGAALWLRLFFRARMGLRDGGQ
jgi:hypothetical protein